MNSRQLRGRRYAALYIKIDGLDHLNTSNLQTPDLRCAAVRAFFAATALAIPALAQVNILTSNYDNERTNSNLQETILNHGNVNTAQFGKLGYFPVDGEIYTQPLYVNGVSIASQGKRNVVYFATMHNTVYAIDADQPTSTTPLWQVNLGPSVPSSILNFTDILPEVGVLSTPAIDLNRQIMYLVSDTLEGGEPVLKLHALSLSDGSEMLNGPVAIAAKVKGNGAGSNGDGTLTFDPTIHLQRPGVTLANGLLYLAFGSRADMGNWHGWLMSYDPTDLQQVAVVCTAPNGYGAALWQAGRAPVVDGSGNLYVVTGNGDFDGTANFGESALKFSGTDLTLLDFFTPSEYATWTDNDKDFGSAGAILIPGTSQLLAAGKSGNLYLANTNSMGHLGAETTGVVQSIQANSRGTFEMGLWNRSGGQIVYLQELANQLKAFAINNGQINPTALSQTQLPATTIFAGLAISANGSNPSSAIVWYTAADNSKSLLPGTLHAYDAGNLATELWNSNMSSNDTLGRFAKFVSPTVANGKVYVPTFSNQLVIYGLLSSIVSPESGPPQITAVTNGASFENGPLSPGELIAIFGANLGPTPIIGAQVDDTDHLATKLSHTKVYIDGVSAPLLYSSANQVGAMVPFGTSRSTVTVQVQNDDQFSTSITLPTAPATPAVFSADGSGGRIGAIINENGKLNSFGNPAPKGSVIMLWATGGGKTNPPGNDGQIVATPPYATPVLPVTVTIDGQPAQVIYAGSAPGMVQGLMQINVTVPAAASSGQVQLQVKVGDYAGPNTVTVVVQ